LTWTGSIKDRQQLTVIRTAARQQRWAVEIIGCPTLREPGGLAMSSRNQRLSDAERAQAAVIHRALSAVRDAAFSTPVEAAHRKGIDVLLTQPSVRLDHLEIVDATTLLPIAEWGGREEAVAVVAAYVGPVRLIDNITLRR
jgi:pantoate--beta-alanine ligase